MANNYLKNHYSERLMFKPLDESAKDKWRRFLASSETNKYLPLHAQNADYVENWFVKLFERYRNNHFGFLGVYLRDSDELLGQIGLLEQDLFGEKILEVGYHLFPEYWGKGYATEGARYFKSFAFDNNLAEKLYSMIHRDNLPSQKVAKRNGMRLEAKTEIWSLPVNLFTIQKSDYEAHI